MSNLQHFFLWWDPKRGWKVCLKFLSQCRQASYTHSTVWETSLPALAVKLQTHFSRALRGSPKNFVGCSQRLTLKDFTIASCIRDKLSFITNYSFITFILSKLLHILHVWAGRGFEGSYWSTVGQFGQVSLPSVPPVRAGAGVGGGAGGQGADPAV